MNKSTIIIIASVVGVSILAVILYMQAAKRKKQIADTERIYKDSIKQTTPTTQTTTPGSGVLLPEYQQQSTMEINFPLLAETQPGGGVLLPEYQDNFGLGFMPGTNTNYFTNN